MREVVLDIGCGDSKAPGALGVDLFALPGVDFISVGALTHSAPAAPMSLEVL